MAGRHLKRRGFAAAEGRPAVPTWVRRLMRPLVGGAKTCKGNGSAADALHGTAQHAYFYGAGGASERPHLGLPSLPAGRRTRAGPLLEKPINVRARAASRISAPLVVDCAQLRARIPPGHAGGHQADAAVNCTSTVESAKTLVFFDGSLDLTHPRRSGGTGRRAGFKIQ